MIFFAVAGPTPGIASRSFSLAVFRSTAVAGADLVFFDSFFEVWLAASLWPVVGFCGAAHVFAVNASTPVNMARENCMSRPPDDSVIYHQNDDGANHRNEDAIQVYSAYSARAKHAE